MPVEIWYIVMLLALIYITFMKLNRPLYECMLYAYILMVAVTGDWGHFFTYILKTSTDTLFYSIVAFLVLAQILNETNAINHVVEIIVSVFGRFRGGAGYAAIAGSTFMGALSGSGAGNVATTGVFTIPSMIHSGFPPHLAANIEAASSTMGNMIPPSGVIVAALACYNEFTGGEMSQSVFWMSMWGVSIWFILQRVITLNIFCRYYEVQPMSPEIIPDLRKTIKAGWKYLLLPIVILLPFILDYLFKSTFYTARLGDGASKMSSSLLLFTPGVAAVYTLIISRKDKRIEPLELARKIGQSAGSIIPVAATIFFAYCISNVFTATKADTHIGIFISSWNLPIPILALAIPLFTALLGMILPGSAQTKIFGSTIISIFAASGGNPLLAAIMMPVITGAMEGMTPPLAICMYTAMGIADSDFKLTTYNCLIWVGLHYILSVICLLGLLPIIGI